MEFKFPSEPREALCLQPPFLILQAHEFEVLSSNIKRASFPFIQRSCLSASEQLIFSEQREFAQTREEP